MIFNMILHIQYIDNMNINMLFLLLVISTVVAESN